MEQVPHEHPFDPRVQVRDFKNLATFWKCFANTQHVTSKTRYTTRFFEDIKQYQDLNKTGGNRPTAGTGKMGNVMQGVFSDGTLVVLTSAQNPNKRIQLVDLYPINLSPLQFDVTGTDVAYIEADVTFNYRSFTVASA